MDAYAHRLAISRRFGTRIAAGDAVFLAGNGTVSGLPCTVSEGEHRSLNGVNRLMLLQVMKDQNWSDPRFFTLAQVNRAGWTVRPDAKPIGLQFLVATDGDGLPSAQPATKRFSVFNAADIEGVEQLRSITTPTLGDVHTAAGRAGFGMGSQGLRGTVNEWLSSSPVLGPYRSVGGASELRMRLAACLLEAAVDLPREPWSESALSQDWLKSIDNEPLAFFYAVKDADVMAATVIQQIHAVQLERETLGIDGIAGAKQQNSTKQQVGGSGMGRNAQASPRVEALFETRTAVLAVPFVDKDRVKQLGAMWYPTQSLWFVPQGVDVRRFKEWALNGHAMGPTASEDTVMAEFRKEMDAMGFDPNAKVICDGKWHNVMVKSLKKSNAAGSYWLNMNGGTDGSPVGLLYNHHTGQTLPWKFDGPVLTPEQRAHVLAQARAREALALLETKKTQDIAAIHASEIWSAAIPPDDHDYIAKKGISGEGLRMVQGAVLLNYDEFKSETGGSIIRANDWYLVVPMANAAGELRAVQAINGDGSVKSFMRGAQKKGTMLVLGANSFDDLRNQPGLTELSYAEGVATGATFRDATGVPVVICFDAGNLETVATETIPHLPETALSVLAVDNDQFHVERAIGMLARELGVNPYGRMGGKTVVWDGFGERSVNLGDSVADGQWHQTAKGKYCMTLQHEEGGQSVRSVLLEVVPNDTGRKLSHTFLNRGVEAGRKIIEAVCAREGCSANIALAVPQFNSLQDRPTDWNDLAELEGLGTVRATLAAQGLGFLGERSHAGKVAEPPIHFAERAALSR